MSIVPKRSGLLLLAFIFILAARLALASIEFPHSPPNPRDSCGDVRLAQEKRLQALYFPNYVRAAFWGSSSYVLSGIGYTGDGVAVLGQLAIFFPILCGVPIAFNLALGLPVFPCLVTKEDIIRVPGIGQAVWKDTYDWREDPRLAQLFSTELAIATCYADRGTPTELKENFRHIRSLKQQLREAKNAGPTGQFGEFTRLEIETRKRLADLDFDQEKALAFEFQLEALGQEATLGGIFHHPETGDQWMWQPKAVSAADYAKSCADLPRKAGEGRFHLATLSQLTRALDHNEFAAAVARIGPFPIFVVVDRDGSQTFSSLLEKTRIDTKEDSFPLLCVR